jgi:hypothetical protein
MQAPIISHDSWDTFFFNKPHPPLICPHCRSAVKRHIHHGAGGWVPTWRCPTHGDVIAVEAKGFKS